MGISRRVYGKNKCKMKGVGKFFLSGKGERKIASKTG